VGPNLIQWRTDPHPAELLPDAGCALAGLEGFHPRAAELTGLLEAIGFQDGFRLSADRPPRLVARIQTPNGVHTLT
jgi:hypothetical protein